ncbi:large conductance mechanosensitive channel protein MscL [Nocardia sp. alder85J]|uniref:large conductance mechanosensitive channel protein MscL n=1 Tax=Nocardia sp. alder85J TaxID=2862949 RepID=UPI001CD1D710|nr:large conductance mechanosensitive channel protein MscL [Nocardia sp. alder85J]MCX4097087.1 large conductance mechanosensitive channel protein MscL [Nocardia sp. alder85J]
MLKGFRDFLLRGNVIELAVAVVMGTAFVAIVTAFTTGIINPLLAMFGGTGELGLGFRLISDKPATFIAVGPIITALLNFLVIALLVYFLVVMPANRAKARWGGGVGDGATDNELLHDIRDLLADERTSKDRN